MQEEAAAWSKEVFPSEVAVSSLQSQRVVQMAPTRYPTQGLEWAMFSAFCSTGIELSKTYSLWENKHVKFFVVVTSAESSMYLRICLPRHEAATKHFFLY